MTPTKPGRHRASGSAGPPVPPPQGGGTAGASGGPSTLLTFSGSVDRDPAIDAWFDARPGPLGLIARTWFRLIRQCGPDVRELLHDGCPTVCVEDAPFAYVNAFRSHVNVGFFLGAGLPDQAGLLQGSGRHMRHVKIRPGQDLDTPSLEALIHAAYRDIVARVAMAE